MTTGCKDIRIRKSEFVAKTKFLSKERLTFMENTPGTSRSDALNLAKKKEYTFGYK